MKELFKDKTGWIALALFVITVLAMGLSKLLMRETNIAIVVMLIASIAIVWVLNAKKIGNSDVSEHKNKNEEEQ